MHTEKELDRIAAKAAVACWLGEEGILAKRIQHDPLDRQLLETWLKRWKLWGKNANVGEIEALRKFLRGVKSQLPKQPVPEFVPRMVEQAKSDGLTRARLTSLISKFAFSCQPLAYVPYDSRGLAGLRALEFNVGDHDYVEYARCFTQIKPQIVSAVTKAGIRASRLKYCGQTLEQDVFEQRAVDKRLMLYGRFPPDDMAKAYWDCDFK